ncbi:MAG: hypothetical protein HKO56_01360 [Bacteroidia bacterium]|nr:hypothetical protein [Bacteroidia bacterium]NNC86518.1 hypothetical protein [Bacteroidia bacterium]NNM15276.1 hypothetical protein [Bacteroidia bacterium]
MRILFYFILVLFLAFSSCSNSSPVQQEKYYFDLISYFNTQVDELNNLNPDVHKSITKNGEMEEKTISDIDWQQELMAFVQADINKPAWKSLYEVDTTVVSNGLVIKYAASDEKLTTRSLEVSISNENEISRIEINTQPDKKIYFANTNMVYVPGKNYSIQTEQNLVLFDKDNFNVKATIIQ